VDEIAGKIPVIAGVLSASTREAVKWSKEAAHLGVDALLVLTPYYNKPSIKGLVAHFRSVAEATDLPIIVYNNPGRTSIKLLPDDYIKLSTIPEIIGVKDCGDDDLLYPCFELGARGGILTTSNVLPSLWVEMYNAIANGDHKKAKTIHYKILPFFQAIMTQNHPALVKKALTLLGLPAGRTRAPLALL